MYVWYVRAFCKKEKKENKPNVFIYKGYHNYHDDTCREMAQHVDRITVSVRKLIDFSFVKWSKILKFLFVFDLWLYIDSLQDVYSVPFMYILVTLYATPLCQWF